MEGRFEAAASLDAYTSSAGGEAVRRAREIGPEAVVDLLTASGLRGRGGAGFPTGTKWRSVLDSGGEHFVVCNGAEGEPATFKDRFLLRQNAYAVLEGLAIAAEAMGATRAYIGVKETFTLEIECIEQALAEFEAAGTFDVQRFEIVRGPDRYLLGEETGLLGVIDGRGPFPRETRPFMQGPFATASRPNTTLVNNVETLANIPGIVNNGADWFRSAGTDSSPGTMLFTVAGDVARESVFELPLGTPLRELIDVHAGGTATGRPVKAVLPGASSTLIGADMLDLPLDFDAFRRAGTGLGAGGFAVYDDTACMVEVAALFLRFLHIESCAQCPACKLHSGAISDFVSSLHAGTGERGDIEGILARAAKVTDGQKCALPTGTQLLTLSFIQAFPHEFAAHSSDECPSERGLVLPKLVDYDEDGGSFLYDRTYARQDPQWTETVAASRRVES